ncbi:MAG: DMT family transporter [Alphaproteobacteria bacterium]
MTSQRATTDGGRALSGILFLLAALFIFTVMDAIAKYLTADYPVIFIMWVRYAFQFGFVLALALRARARLVPRTARLGLQVGRAILNVASTFLFIFALRFVALADAVALTTVGPLFLTALSVPLLGEKVGIRRWTAVVVGFAGALIILRPGLGVVHWAGSILMLSSLVYALYQIATRIVARSDAALTTLFYTTAVGVVLSSAIVPFEWKSAPLEVWLLLVVQGGLGALAHLSLITAFERVAVSTIAPFNYAAVVMATVVGYAVFGTFPDRWTILGTLVVVASGLYVIYREAVRRRERQEEAAP